MKNLQPLLTRFYLAVTFFLFVAARAQAQDVVKVSPETHRVLLENERVRALDVHVKVGEKVPTHSHPAGILYYLSDAKLRITYPDGRTEERQMKAGTAVWSEAVTHAVENVGTSELHEIHTELKEAAKKPGRH
jgi:beta-alanine degradation protein BauB